MWELVKTILHPVMTKEWHVDLVLHLLSLLEFFSHLAGLLTVTPGLLRFTFIEESEILLEAARPLCCPAQTCDGFLLYLE